ncbi:hypothetical protein Tco_1276155 [Tanacetum coccineum]
MVDHSQKWHDGSTNRNIGSNNNTDGLAAIVSKLDNLGRDMKKLKENVHAIQVGCQTCGGPHLDKECSLNKEVKGIEEVKYGDYSRPFLNNNRNYQPYSRERKPSLIETINKYMEEATKRQNLESKVRTLTTEVETEVTKLEE